MVILSQKLNECEMITHLEYTQATSQSREVLMGDNCLLDATREELFDKTSLKSGMMMTKATKNS